MHQDPNSMKFPRNKVLVFAWLLASILLYSCNKNEYAPEMADQEFSIPENSDENTLVGIVEASDADEGQVLSYEILEGNEAGAFQIESPSGELLVLSSAPLNYEEQSEFTLSLVVTDKHKKDPLETMASILVRLKDVNLQPGCCRKPGGEGFEHL